MPKFFVTPQDIVGKKITLTGENEKHIKTVLRAREGEEITVCDGEGTDYQCRILSLERGVVTEVLSSAPCRGGAGNEDHPLSGIAQSGQNGMDHPEMRGTGY